MSDSIFDIEKFKKYHSDYHKEWSKRNKHKRTKYNKEYYKRNKVRIIKQVKEYHRNNPAIGLKANIKQLEKHAIPLKLPYKKFKYALWNWSKTIRKQNHGICGMTGCLKKADHAHHLLYKTYYPQLALNLNNGISLCKRHHDETHGKNLMMINS